MNINQALLWILNSGGAAIILSFILERIPKYTDLEAETKRWIFFGGSFVISVLAYLVLTYVSVDVLNQIAPYFALLYSTFLANFGGTLFHSYDKNTKSEG